MPLLGARLYDPPTAVVKSTAALSAMTALDTTNLRISFSAPASGAVVVRMSGTVHGAATSPVILFGLMSGANVDASMSASMTWAGAQAATSMVACEALFCFGPGTFSPGQAVTWDAAMGVEVAVTGSGMKYGGPNNATANDAFGAFCFEVWTG